MRREVINIIKTNFVVMSTPVLYELKITVELPKGDVVEDEAYKMAYLIENVGKVDFPAGGSLICTLNYPLWDSSYVVNHKWNGLMDAIPIDVTIRMEPYAINAVAGPNAFVFHQIIPVRKSTLKVYNHANDEISGGAFISYLRVKTVEEVNSSRNLKYALFSLIILIFLQGFDWFLQLWLNNKICIQNLTTLGLVEVVILTIILAFLNSKYTLLKR